MPQLRKNPTDPEWTPEEQSAVRAVAAVMRACGDMLPLESKVGEQLADEASCLNRLVLA